MRVPLRYSRVLLISGNVSLVSQSVDWSVNLYTPSLVHMSLVLWSCFQNLFINQVLNIDAGPLKHLLLADCLFDVNYIFVG